MSYFCAALFDQINVHKAVIIAHVQHMYLEGTDATQSNKLRREISFVERLSSAELCTPRGAGSGQIYTLVKGECDYPRVYTFFFPFALFSFFF